jgi:RND family efflux transporter MFP subunit
MMIWMRRIVIAGLFAGLVVVLLWFQGILWRHEHAPVEVPDPPALAEDARTAEVQWRELLGQRTYPGFVEAVDPAAVAARVMADVVRLEVREGDTVSAGQLLVELDDRDARAALAQARAALTGAEARLMQAGLAFARAEELRQVEATTEQNWEAARAERDTAAAMVESARQAVALAETALGWYRLRAPFDGQVLERHADPGDLAAPGSPLLVIYRPNELRLAVAVPEELAGGLATGDSLSVRFDAASGRTGRLTRLLPSADPRTGTVTLQLALPDARDLQPGRLGRLALTTEARQALLIPAEAVERIGQIERVRLVREGRVAPQTVRTGKRDGAMVEILSGLSAGDRVVLP